MQRLSFRVARAGVVCALYCILSFITLPVSGGAIQFRLSEGLNLLPLLFVDSIPALFIGCLLFNFISGLALYDVLLGALITLVSAILVYFTGKIIKKDLFKVLVGGLFPVVLNAFGLPLIWLYLCQGLAYTYGLQVGLLIISQGLSVYAFGSVFYYYLNHLQKRGVKYFIK